MNISPKRPLPRIRRHSRLHPESQIAPVEQQEAKEQGEDMAGALYKPKVRSFLLLVRRLLCRRSKPPGEKEEGEKRRLLTRSSLEDLLVSDVGDGGCAAAVCVCTSPCAKNDDQGALPGQQPPVARPEAMAIPVVGGDDVFLHRRFGFGGFRRRLLRRPWRPMLLAIPE